MNRWYFLVETGSTRGTVNLAEKGDGFYFGLLSLRCLRFPEYASRHTELELRISLARGVDLGVLGSKEDRMRQEKD